MTKVRRCLGEGDGSGFAGCAVFSWCHDIIIFVLFFLFMNQICKINIFSVCFFFSVCVCLFYRNLLRDCGGVVVPGGDYIGGYFVIFMCKIAPRSFFQTSPTQR